MPQLGLGLGLHKNSLGLTPLQLLLKYTSAMWHVPKATGTSEGINSPFTNPLIDLKGTVGMNLFDGFITSGKIWNTTSMVQTTVVGFKCNALPIVVDANTNYYLSSNGVNFNADNVRFYTEAGAYISQASGRGAFTTPINCKYVCFYAADAKFVGANIQLELGSVATSYEPYGKANLLLQGFAGTTSSGYVGVLCPNGKTVPFLKFDGTNDLGIANHPSLDILGTSDFGFGKLISVPSLVTHYPFTKAESSEATTQYGLKITNTGVLSIILQGTTIQLATGLVITNLYAIWVERISGVLKCFINGVEVFSVANTTSLTSRPNFRVGALSTDVGGTTHTGFSNANVGSLVVVKTDVLKARSAYFKFTLLTFGI